MAASLLTLNHIRKSFDGIYALSNISLELIPNECVAVVGENGAGKSTLMKILSGVWPHGSFEGEILYHGKLLRLTSPLDGRRHGISIIHQELCLFPGLTVAENIFLTENYPYRGTPSQDLFGLVRWRVLFQKAEKLLRALGFDIDATCKVEDLSVAQRQLVEIARAFHQNASILILDEPTSALSKIEVEILFEAIRRMRDQVTFVYISHKLDEVFELADRIVVLRDGVTVADLRTEETNVEAVIHHMVGRPTIAPISRRGFGHPLSGPVLEVDSLTHVTVGAKPILKNIRFELHAGEILGIAGLMGSGRSELLRSLLGILPGKRAGNIFLCGMGVRWQSVGDAMDSGVVFVPEDRKKDGLFLDHSVVFNLSISVLKNTLSRFGAIKPRFERDLVEEHARKMRVKCKSFADPVRILSGGNQQKVLLAKVVATHPKILFLDEPTRGIDIGAKEEIYEIIRDLAKMGMSMLLVSSELPELMLLSDRILVLREGEQTGILSNENLTEEQVMACVAGGNHGVC